MKANTEMGNEINPDQLSLYNLYPTNPGYYLLKYETLTKTFSDFLFFYTMYGFLLIVVLESQTTLCKVDFTC